MASRESYLFSVAPAAVKGARSLAVPAGAVVPPSSARAGVATVSPFGGGGGAVSFFGAGGGVVSRRGGEGGVVSVRGVVVVSRGVGSRRGCVTVSRGVVSRGAATGGLAISVFGSGRSSCRGVCGGGG